MSSLAQSDHQPISDLNTTPLIDVMLVLLIMLIVTIPIQTHKVPIDLPTAPPPLIDVRPDRNALAVDSEGRLFWNGAAIDMPGLVATLDRVGAMQPQPELQFLPHPEARYDRVEGVMAAVKRANVSTMGIVGNENYRNF